MKIKELRIGNLIYNPPKKVVEVVEINRHHALGVMDAYKHTQYYVDADYFHPIPLTPEVLEGCRFESDSNSSIYMTGDRSVILELPRKEQEAYGFHRLRILNTDDDWRGADLNMVTNELPLHRLQNIIHALTGEELDVEGVENLEHGT